MGPYLEEWEATVPSETTRLSRAHSELLFDVRPVGFRWMVRCTGPLSALDRLVVSGAPSLTLLRVERASDPLVVYAYPPSPQEIAFLRDLGSSGDLLLPPLTVRDGIARVRVLVPSGESPAERRLAQGPARLVARRRLTRERLREEVERLAPGRLGLTPQQSRVLLQAVRDGYYEVPRRVTVEDVARRLSLGRSTVEEHLRRAESRIVSRAAPVLELSEDERMGPEGRPEHVTGFSSEIELFVDLALRGDRVTDVRLLRSAPASGLRPNHPHLRRVLKHLESGREDLRDIPVDLHVSPFERQVLEEVRRIPAGETRSYGEIARRIGRPGASRAVGNAVAHNPVPVVIPCHRVVPLHGGIGYYSAGGGPQTKERLLVREGAIPAPQRATDSSGPSVVSPRVPDGLALTDRRKNAPSRRPRRIRATAEE